MANFPPFALDFPTLQSFPNKFDLYYKDHFGFRNTLIRLNFLVKYKCFGVSPSNQVVIGKDGWLFFTGAQEIEDYRGITHYNDAQLKKWAISLELKRQWLESKGIRYLFVLAPNKSTIYGEFMPDSLPRVRPTTCSDELIGYMRKHTKVEIVDLRQPLLKAKQQNPFPLYYKTDSHWNDYGAFLAYQEMFTPIVHWFPSVRKLTVDDFAITQKSQNGRDLAAIIGGTELTRDVQLDFTPRKPFKAQKVGFNNNPRVPFAMTQDNSRLPRAIVFIDSFFEAIVPFVSESLQFTKYSRDRWNADMPIVDMLNKYHPDIVIEETVERLIKTEMTDFSDNMPGYFSQVSPQISIDSMTKLLPLYQKFDVDQDTTVVKRKNGIMYKSKTDDPRIILPYKLDGKDKMIKISIDSPCDTYLQFYYGTSDSPQYSERNSIKHNIRIGHNNLEVLLNNTGATGQLRLDPGARSGSYLIRSLEIGDI